MDIPFQSAKLQLFFNIVTFFAKKCFKVGDFFALGGVFFNISSLFRPF